MYSRFGLKCDVAVRLFPLPEKGMNPYARPLKNDEIEVTYLLAYLLQKVNVKGKSATSSKNLTAEALRYARIVEGFHSALTLSCCTTVCVEYRPD